MTFPYYGRPLNLTLLLPLNPTRIDSDAIVELTIVIGREVRFQ